MKEYHTIDYIRKTSRPPINKTAVILLSGGLDSAVMAELCIKYWKTYLYPLYVRRGASAEKYELQSAKSVVRYLQDKYPSKISNLEVVSSSIPPKTIKVRYPMSYRVRHGYPLRNLILLSIALQHGITLRINNLDVSTILIGSMHDDTAEDSSRECLLLNNYTLCTNSGDWSWRIFSALQHDKLLPGCRYIIKEMLVKWARDMDFPLGIVRSCQSSNPLPCGQCISCRKNIELGIAPERSNE